MTKEPTSKELWLEAPDGHLADSLKWIVRDWNDEPTATGLLKLLDYCAYCGGASTFVMKALNLEYINALKQEQLTDEEVRKIADLSWRIDLHNDI